ncbi:MAG: glycoside hydrolase family 3 protein, partial [Parasporobacterium sp.]|nr:glycoside hydrolase family 3 protein [Parasporobacterium sp.]
NPATCFPAAVTTSASWDPQFLESIGRAIGEEAHAQKAGLVLGPGANLKRNPLCGRNFEYFSEDPLLSGKLAAGFIRGVESEGIGACLKHFAANSQEHCRFNSNGVMDERTLRELYLSAFELAVKEANPSAVMCAYPKLNGIHCSDNRKLLTEILREEWGFEGLVVTDWGAMNDRVEGFKAGCDLNMPGGSAYMEKEALEAVRSGSLPEQDVDASAERIIRLALREGENLKQEVDGKYEDHHLLAKKAALQGAVLLKNENHILPIPEEKKIALIGYMAKHLRYQGGGSSHINAIQVSNPIDYLSYASFAEGCDEKGDTTEELLREAAEKAGQAETAIVFAGLPDRYDNEGFDRTDMKLPEGHIRMIETAAAANPNTVVVLFSGSAVECSWSNHVKGILYMGLPGEAGGEAAADLLYGKENPSGKLAESWPIIYEDCISSSFFGKEKDALYLEGIYVGYRYYDKAEREVRFPFGFGLSYTEYEYSKLEVLGDTVRFMVKNNGEAGGAEIAQLYVETPQDGIHRPKRELKHFAKIWLQPGESKAVSFDLTDRDFSVWQDGWKVPAGEYTICVGGSSRDLPLKKTILKEGEEISVSSWQSGSFYETCEGRPVLSDLENAAGFSYVPDIPKKGSFTMDNTILEMKDESFVMKIVYKIVESGIAKQFGIKKDYDDPEFRLLIASSAGSPLRSLQIFGGMQGKTAEGLLEMANGHFFRGLRKMVSRARTASASSSH